MPDKHVYVKCRHEYIYSFRTTDWIDKEKWYSMLIIKIIALEGQQNHV